MTTNTGASAVSLATDVLDPYRSRISEVSLHLSVVLNWYFIRVEACSLEIR